MSLKSELPRPMPMEMIVWGTTQLANDNLYKLIGDTLYQQYHNEDFTDLLSQRQSDDPVASLCLTPGVESTQHYAESRCPMSLKPQPPQPIPLDTKALVGLMLDEDTVYRFVGDVLFSQFQDADFADLYPAVGQPSISPVLLSFVLIFQALEDLSDRAAVNALRFRLDWKYALHLPLCYPSFDHTVVSEFRKRLLTHDAEARVFGAIFAQLKQLGFYKQRGIQRTDSIAIFSHCRELRRIKLCVETMRTTIKSLLHHDPD